MRITKLVGERVKEIPAGVSCKSHEYLLRGGFIKQMCNGIYSMLPAGLKIQRKIENIIREELNKDDGQEVLFPVMMPREIWDESGRFTSIGNEMFRLKDRSGHDMVLGMTHEEAAVHMARNTVKSYDQLPFMIYQIQTKLRDEPRARAGLIRVREFTMKDAYSFHETNDDLVKYYWRMYDCYTRIFKRIGMKNFIAVQSDSGMMGGRFAHEFMMLTDIGEDTLVLCDKCDAKANMEVAESIIDKHESKQVELKKVYTAEKQSIEEVSDMLKVKDYQTCKAVCYFLPKSNKYVVVFLRGDLEVNEVKLLKVTKEEFVPVSVDETSGLCAGYIGPKGLDQKKFMVVFDSSLEHEKNLVVGANEKGYHLTGFSFERDIKVSNFFDVHKINEKHLCAECKEGHCKLVKGVEIGQIFQLEQKYTKSMNMTIINKNGESIYPTMGCYGIGVGRAIACVAEESSDEKGLVWPVQIAPWHVYLCPLRLDNENVKLVSEKIYANLEKHGIEVLLDDREVSAGIKFADSELMGIPFRIVVSPRSLENNQVEVLIRATGEKIMCGVDEIDKFIRNLVKNSL